MISGGIEMNTSSDYVSVKTCETQSLQNGIVEKFFVIKSLKLST